MAKKIQQFKSLKNNTRTVKIYQHSARERRNGASAGYYAVVYDASGSVLFQTDYYNTLTQIRNSFGWAY